MRTVILGPRPPEIDALIARRQALGIDRFDEIWEGDYHLAPAAPPRHGVVTMMIGDLLKAPADAAGLIRSTDCNEQVERSSLLGVAAAEIQAGIDWP